MNVVVDTNVFVSSFFGGLPRRIVELWGRGLVTLCVSREIIDEYTAVLVRLGLTEGKDLAELLELFARGKHSLFIGKTPTVKIVKSDPSDDKFIECAVALKAICVITGDKALLNVGNYAGIEILTPRDFLGRHFPDAVEKSL